MTFFHLLKHMLIPYPLSIKLLAKMLKQILASALLVWSLWEGNLTIEKKKHRCLKQKAGDGKTKHIWHAVCWTFLLSLTCEQKPSRAVISISMQAPCGCFHILTLQEQQMYAAYLGQRIYFGVGEDEQSQKGWHW